MIEQPALDLSTEQLMAHSENIIQEVEKAIIGKRETLEKILAALLCSGGHILLEDYPGLAKTLIANSFATVLGLHFKRVQFTPDLLPGDTTGGYIFDSSRNQRVLHKGPLFTNVLLADEINRASPKTQSALLEAMQERQVTIGEQTFRLEEPFLVMATQNPIEQEGTYPLPEAQVDRLMLKLRVTYPNKKEEKQIMKRIAEHAPVEIAPVITPREIMESRKVVDQIYLDEKLEDYIVDIVFATALDARGFKDRLDLLAEIDRPDNGRR